MKSAARILRFLASHKITCPISLRYIVVFVYLYTMYPLDCYTQPIFRNIYNFGSTVCIRNKECFICIMYSIKMARRRVDESKYLVSLYEIKYTYTHSKLEINITYGKYIDRTILSFYDSVTIRNIYLYINIFSDLLNLAYVFIFIYIFATYK